MKSLISRLSRRNVYVSYGQVKFDSFLERVTWIAILAGIAKSLFFGMSPTGWVILLGLMFLNIYLGIAARQNFVLMTTANVLRRIGRIEQNAGLQPGEQVPAAIIELVSSAGEEATDESVSS